MTVRRLFVLIFVAALFVMPVRETLDPDMWWHLQTGEYILEQGIPHQDPFSFTVRGRPWIAHEWLADLFMAGVHRAGGLPALILVFAGVVALTFWLVYRTCVGRPYLAAFITLLAALAAGGTWGARPQMFNALLLATFVYVVERVKDDRLDRRAFLALPLLTVVWANLHSGYFLGVVLLGVYVVGEGVQARFGPPAPRQLDGGEIRWLGGVTLSCFAAALLNPNGYRLWIYPFETLGSNAMQTYILEWKSPNFHLHIFWPFGLMLVVGVLGLILSTERPTWTDLLLFFGTGAAGLLSARHITIFAIVAAPRISRYWSGILATTRLRPLLRENVPQPRPSRLQAGFHWAIAGLLAALVVVRIGQVVRNNEAAIAAVYPVAAVDFIEQRGWEEQPGYNSYNWGGYLIWRGVPVFVDGRADVYMDEFLLYYLQAFQVEPGWQEPLDEYGVDYVLMERDTPLTVLLEQSDGWQQAYVDEVAQIFTRATR